MFNPELQPRPAPLRLDPLPVTAGGIVRKDDLLPQQMRLMTEDGLRFVATYRGLIKFALSARDRGGPHSDKWGIAADRATRCLDLDDEDGIEDAIKSFSLAARSEGWVR